MIGKLHQNEIMRVLLTTPKLLLMVFQTSEVSYVFQSDDLTTLCQFKNIPLHDDAIYTGCVSVSGKQFIFS